MVIQSMELDPNAQAYTDDEIVGKVNAATVKVSADQTQDGTTNKVFTAIDETKLISIEDNAKDDQSGDEMVVAINAGVDILDRVDVLDYDALNIVKTGPPSGGFKVKQLDRTSDGKLDVKYDDIVIP